MQYPIFIYWDCSTNPESNTILARYNSEEEIKPFPKDIRDSFLFPFYNDCFNNYTDDDFEKIEVMKYYDKLTKLDKWEALTEIESGEFIAFCYEYLCDDLFYVFYGQTAVKMFDLTGRGRLRVSV